jgi:hypothetical protein
MDKQVRIIFVYVFAVFLSLNFASAVFGYDDSFMGVYKQGTDIQLYQICSNCTFINITSVIGPDGTKLVGNSPMTKDGSIFNYTLSKNLTKQVGTYTVSGIGDPNGANDIWTYKFEVTYSGFKIQDGQGFIYISLFLLLIFFFVVTLYTIARLPKSNDKDHEERILSINKLKYLRPVGWVFLYLLVVMIFYLASNIAFAYLPEQLLARTFFLIFRLLFMFAPLIFILWLIKLFVMIIEDRKLKKMLERGIFPSYRM